MPAGLLSWLAPTVCAPNNVTGPAGVAVGNGALVGVLVGKGVAAAVGVGEGPGVAVAVLVAVGTGVVDGYAALKL